MLSVQISRSLINQLPELVLVMLKQGSTLNWQKIS